ncbi:MAG: 23S rRNA (pseudouridine(1915)-N(3))-methyltransferase RlmH [Deltaproteobacteria bacterium]|nr:MAG: 23S rRNA (pseudouridine(1915)-N(3))-methyltransferase RlmH [Deltaproteobacteria bacterium]
MPRIRIIVVGQTKLPFLFDGQQFYLDRLQHYTTIDWLEVKPVSIKKTREQFIKEEEGLSILRYIKDRDYVIALDQRGRTCDSKGWASQVEQILMEQGGIVFVVGGTLGLSEKVLTRAQATLSLSRLTFTHEMARLFLLEQLYRAFTILRGEKYHK